MQWPRRHYLQYLLLTILVLVLIFTAGCLSQTIPKDTKVDELDLSGLSFNDGRERLKGWAEDKLAETRLLVYNNTEVQVSLGELGLKLDLEKTWERVRNQIGNPVPSILQLDPAKTSQTLQTKLAGVIRFAQDASYKIEDDKFLITPAVTGHILAIDSFIKELEGFSFAQIPAKINIPVTEVPAKVTTEAVQALAFDSIIAEFSTEFSTYDSNRVDNLTLAAQTLDKKEIHPGETFSFNDTVGPRTLETGYKEAKTIFNDEFVYGTGGGVCQVSTTLYNTILLANLPIVERKPHSVTIGYVPLGRDATVSYPDIDLKFKNDTSGLIYLRTEVKSGTITIKIWGKKSTKTVQLVNEIEQETGFKTERHFDSNLPVGKTVLEKAGSKGYIVKTWRVIQDDQGAKVEQLLSRDVYAPVNQILKVGTSES